MRKKIITLIITVLCVLSLLTLGLFACGKVERKDTPEEGRMITVSSAMNTLSKALLAADGSKDTRFFTLASAGSFVSEGKQYTFTLNGSFDISEVNREDDKRTQLSFEIKEGSTSVLLVYYSEGALYLDFAPYARRARLSDFNLAQAVYELYNQKNSGVIKDLTDAIPAIGMRLFATCRQHVKGQSERYVFTLSYPDLAEVFSSLVESLDAGFTPGELLAALHLTQEQMQALAQSAAETTVEVCVENGVFSSAKAETDGNGVFSLDSFSLTRGSDDVALPSGLNTFTEFDFGNFALSGTLYLDALPSTSSDEVNYGVSVGRDYYEVSYPFTYDFKSHYVAGSGYEFSLALTDKNGKASYFAVKGEYLYADLSAYGIQKAKIKTQELSDRLGIVGFKDTKEYDFKEKLHLLTLLAAARSEEGDVVTYRLGSEFFKVLSEKIAFQGLFGVDEATLSWSKANDRLQSLTASLTVGEMTAHLSAASFTFGSPVEITAPNDAEYYDIGEKDGAHLSATGVISQHTSAFDGTGAYLSAWLSSLSGESVVFETQENETLSYVADLQYGATGALDRFFCSLIRENGDELVTVYYTSETADSFYLIYPAATSGVRPLRVLSLVQDPLDAFNRTLGAADSETGNKVLLTARDNTFTIGVQSPMISFIEQKLALLYPDFSLPYMKALKCRSYELEIASSRLTGRVRFDGDNDLTVTATKFSLTFGEENKWDLVSLNAATPQRVALLADNTMPEYATVTFANLPAYKISLLDYNTEKKIWRYLSIPTSVGSEGQETEVTAVVTLFGRTVSKKITVDISPASSVGNPSGSVYGNGRFDVNTRSFNFNLYNDVNPETVLATFNLLSVTAGGVRYTKDVTWVINKTAKVESDVPDENDSDITYHVTTYTVIPQTKTYFGNVVSLGNQAKFSLVVKGNRAVTTDYSKTFVAYDKNDPLDPAAYSSVIYVTTAVEGEGPIEIRNVTWDLSNSTIESYAKAHTLYRYQTADVNNPDYVLAIIKDVWGNQTPLRVRVYFEARVIDSVEFDLSSLKDGVTYDADTATFYYDVLKIKELLSTRTDGLLPSSFVANADDAATRFTMAGEWEFEHVTSVENDKGASGTLKMTVGDAISGHQTLLFNYAFRAIEITGVELLDKDENVIDPGEQGEDIFHYTFNGLDAYSYSYPKYVRVAYRYKQGGNSELQYETLEPRWASDKTFNESALCEGGTYVLTTALGSETLTVELQFGQARITAYSFTEAQRTTANGVVPITEKTGLSYLTYTVLDSLGETSGLNYKDPLHYPAKMMVALNGDASCNVEADVTWDLSAYDEKTDIIGNGYFGTVKAIVKGQVVEVNVYVSPAVGSHDIVYVAENEQKLTFRVLTRTDDSGYKVTDPRKVENYPSELIVYNTAADKEFHVAVTWSGLEEVTKLYTTQLSQGKAVNKVSGEVTVTATIKNTTSKINVVVAVVESEIENINVSGLPFAASSELTGGTTPYAITANVVDGSIVSLDINPYYVNPLSEASYPAYLDFLLNKQSVHTKAVWDLTAIPENAATDPTRTQYEIKAMLDLGKDLPNIVVPIRVNVLKRKVDKVWIDGSSQPYIDLDSYAANPFGSEVSDDDENEVILDVKVQFVGDANRYPLKLKYNKAGIVLSYDGSSVYDGLTVYVGNENGGYQAIENYGVRVISHIVSQIVLSEEDRLVSSSNVHFNADGVFFRAVKQIDGDSLTYSYYHVMDMGKPLPTSLSVTFGEGSAPQTVYRFDQEQAKGAGVVFEWVRNSDGYIGVEFYNPSVDETTGGVRQAIYNRYQSDYNTPSDDMFFGSEVWTMTYRDSEDAEGYITPQWVLAYYGPSILTADVAEKYQRRFITADAENAEEIALNATLNAGTYRLYVEVDGHTHYSGKVYKTFTITKKDITSFVVLVVDDQPRENGYSVPYKPAPNAYYEVEAGLDGYPIAVRLCVDGVSKKNVKNVVYGASGEPTFYEIAVTVSSEETNYTVTNKTLNFKVYDIEIADLDNQLEIGFSWQSATSTFAVSVELFEEELALDPGLTNGYKISYYAKKGDTEEVTVLEYGLKYYYIIDFKIPNYVQGFIEQFITAR